MKALLAGLMLIVAFASVGWVTIVTNIQGRSVAETAPTNGQVYFYDSTSGTWKPGTSPVSAHQSTHQPGGSDSLSDTYVVTTRSVTAAGSYVTGGGDLSANRTISLALGAVSADVTPTWTNIQSKPSTFDPSAHQSTHQPGQPDSLSDTFVVTTRSITAGTGLLGGGDLSADRTLAVDSSVLTPSYSNLQGTPSTFAPSAHAASHTNGTDNLTVSGFLTVDATAGISPRYNTSDFDVSAGNLVLRNVISAGTVGDASNFPVLGYDAKGRITSVSTMPLTSVTAAAAVEQHELIPLYIYPDANWTTVGTQSPGTGMVIFNPNSGPGVSYDSTYKTYIQALQRKGVYCVGYVATTYGARDIDTVKAEVAKYYEWYSPDGIFFDEVPTTTGSAELTYYADLYAYAKTRLGRALVVLNPGTNTAEEYMARSDIICTWENPYSTYAAYVPDAWTTKYPANRFYHIAVEASDAEATTFKALAKSRNVGWVYATDDATPNPFDALPTYGVTQTGYLRTCAVAPLLENTGTPTGTYGSSSKSAVLTVDDKGRVTNITETAMPVDQAQATGSLRTIATTAATDLGTVAAAGNGTAASAYDHVHKAPTVTAGSVSAKPCTALIVNAGTGATITGSESSGTVNVTVSASGSSSGVPGLFSGGYVSRSGNNLILLPSISNRIYLYESSAWTEHSIPDAGATVSCVSLSASTAYYCYAYDTGSAVGIELSTTAPTTQNGISVKNGATNYLLIARCYANASGAITTYAENAATQLVCNVYNKRQLSVYCIDTTDSWTYSTNLTWRCANNSSGNRVYVVSDGTNVVHATARVNATVNAANAGVGIGVDATNANAAEVHAAMNGGAWANLTADYAGGLSAGYHYLAWLEYVSGTSATFYGDNANTELCQSGIFATGWF